MSTNDVTHREETALERAKSAELIALDAQEITAEITSTIRHKLSTLMGIYLPETNEGGKYHIDAGQVCSLIKALKVLSKENIIVLHAERDLDGRPDQIWVKTGNDPRLLANAKTVMLHNSGELAGGSTFDPKDFVRIDRGGVLVGENFFPPSDWNYRDGSYYPPGVRSS